MDSQHSEESGPDSTNPQAENFSNLGSEGAPSGTRTPNPLVKRTCRVVSSDAGQDLFVWSRGFGGVVVCRPVLSCGGGLGLASGSQMSAGVVWFRLGIATRAGVVVVMVPGVRRDPVVSAVSIMVGVVVGLTFLFGFGNVLALALRLGVPVWVAPLVAPAVDLTVVALLVAVRRLSSCGASPATLRSARWLLVGASVVTLALNVAEPLAAGEVGKALFDAVGPLLLIGWSEVGPGLLQALVGVRGSVEQRADESEAGQPGPSAENPGERTVELDPDLVERARQIDAEHRARHQRPVSAEVLRKALGGRGGTFPFVDAVGACGAVRWGRLSFVGGCLS